MYQKFEIACKVIPPIYKPFEIEIIRNACKIARGALDAAHSRVAVGVTTE
jgi:methionine aminopeptidase